MRIKNKFFVLFFLLLLPSFIFAQTCNNNGVCDSSEDKCSCSNDCGECKGDVPGEVCKIYSCATGLCRPTVIYYCCGNHFCESGENFANCSVDCPPKEIKIELIEPDSNKFFMRGELLTISVMVKADGKPAMKANVKTDNFMGSLTLYDDGNHSDKRANDGIYATSFLVPEATAEGFYASSIYAEMAGVSSTKNFNIEINPELELSFSLDSNSYGLGDIINASGTLKKRGLPLKREVSFRAFSDATLVFESKAFSDENGLFSFSEHTALNQPEGNWMIEVSAKDQSNNEGKSEKIIQMKKESIASFLDIKFVSSPKELFFARGELMKVLLDLSFESEPIHKAKAKALLPNNETQELREVSNGRYLLEYLIPIDFPLGTQKINFNAIKDINSVNYSGSNSIDATIDKANIELELIEPKKSVVALGEILNFNIKASYGGTIPVSNATLIAQVNSEPLEMTEKETGLYAGSFLIDEAFVGKNKELVLSLDLNDSFGNISSKTVAFEVAGELTLEYFLRTNPLIFFALIIFVAFFIVVIILARKRIGRISALEKRREELNRLRTDLQEKYFNKRTISSEEYYSLLNQYTSELRDIDSTIEAFSGKKRKPEEPVEGEKVIEEELIETERTPRLFKIREKKKEGEEVKKGDEEQEFTGLFKIKKKKEDEKNA